MMFELSPAQAAGRDQARRFAEGVSAQAAVIDRDGTLPPDLARDARALASDDAVTTVVAVEEVAAASAAVASAIGSAAAGSAPGLSGLRGAVSLEDSPRTQLVLAGVALGVGRAAVDAALAELRESNRTPGADVEKPHWAVADAATELEAARLLTYKAAQTSSDADIAIARLMATAAATRAVDTAIRVIGPRALVDGSTMERLSRDVRALAVLAGTEEAQRAAAAEGLLPR
jgi:alkylation response protein AidB-like acyl-CoA dehydrogenase